jgi:hypothetical protein
MKRTTFNAIGGFQSFLFCVGMYVVALFFSIFVCSAIFYAVNSKSNAREVAKTVMPVSGQQQLASVTH